MGWIRGRQVELDLVLIGQDRHGRDMFLHRPAAHDYLAMQKHAKADGIDFILNRAWASMLDQQFLYDQYQTDLERHRARVAEGLKSKAPSLVAEPGRSTHQAGCSADLNRAHDDHTNDGKANGKTDLWLAGNAKVYGFVNDVRSEPWHWTHAESLAALLRRMGLK